MTREEFIAVVQLHTERVNIWYENTTNIIQGISVPVIDDGYQNITNYLTQVQQIVVPLTIGGVVSLDIISRELIHSTISGIQVTCFYFDVTPVQIATLTTTTVDTNIQLLPAIDGAEFYDSPYNTLQGSIEDIRTSSYIMQSDRYKIGTLANPTYTGPINIALLLSGSAPLAHVQDSNYTTTGWINARYNGSKTDSITYKTDPAIGGSIFQGAEFPASASNTQIKFMQDSGQVAYKEIFYAGTGDSPGFYPIPSGYMFTGSMSGLDLYETAVTITKALGESSTPKSPTVGDLIRIGSEIMKINSIGVLAAPWLRYTLQVTRGYNSEIAIHSNQALVDSVSQVQIYNITGNKLTGIPKGRVLVKDTGVAVRLDQLGYIISSEQVLVW
jgi:hypothetical protein